MNVLRYRRWPQAVVPGEAGALFQRIEGAANTEAGPWLPRVDIREEDGQFVLLADLPGVDPATIELQMDRNVLSISGERRHAALAEGQRQVLGERREGRFARRFVLPDSADADGITASGRHGVLEVRIPKKAEVAPRRIQVGGDTLQ